MPVVPFIAPVIRCYDQSSLVLRKGSLSWSAKISNDSEGSTAPQSTICLYNYRT